ncbi:hypothetical protein RQN30_08870 [Arcanobacterium hippocoleae]
MAKSTLFNVTGGEMDGFDSRRESRRYYNPMTSTNTNASDGNNRSPSPCRHLRDENKFPPPVT